MVENKLRRIRPIDWLLDSRLWWMIFSSFWVLLILGSAFDYVTMDVITGDPDQVQPIWRLIAFLTATGFTIVYVWMMYWVYFSNIWDADTKKKHGFRIALLAMAIMLNTLPSSGETGFNFAFMFAAIAFVLTGQHERSTYEVLRICAVAAVVLLLTGNGDRIILTLIFTVAFGFMVGAQHRNIGLIHDLYLEQSRVRDQAITEERFRLARDLHDTVGHSMTQITLKAELARRLLPDDPSRAADELEQIEHLSRALSADVRASIAGNTSLTLAQEIDRASELLASMDIENSVSGDRENLPEAAADAFAWCLREGVLNVVKHSGADRCEIIFSSTDEHYLLKINDNGKHPVEDEQKGQGINGMHQRVDELGGDLEFRLTDSGHALIIRIPA